MTQEGETEGYTAADHVDALLSHGAPGLVDLCLANSAPVRPGLVEKYREEDAAPILVDRERIAGHGAGAGGVSGGLGGGRLCPPRPGPAGGGGAGACTAGGRCASSGANSGTSLRSETMSFAGETKGELCRTALNRKCCAQAEAYGVLLYCNTFSGREIRIITENEAFAQRLPILFRKAFRLSFDRLPDGEGKYSFGITDPAKLAAVSGTFGMDAGSLANHVNFAVLEEPCCRAAFLRGAFLAGGSVTDPRKAYHLELSTSHYNVSREVPALMREAGFQPKEATRKANYIAYFKQSERIEDFLTAIGAPLAAMEIMNAKLEKNLRGSVNRRVNCDAANLDKAVEAAQVQLEAIRSLEQSGQLEGLPDKLRETARLRLEHPEDTLAELAALCDPPATKSALNHRLRKLVELGQTRGEGAGHT